MKKTRKRVLCCLGTFMMAISSAYAKYAVCTDINSNKVVHLSIYDKTSRGLEVALVLEDDHTKLEGSFYNLTRFWDGHHLGLLTGEAISIVYEDNYGQILVTDITAYLSLNGTKNEGQGWIETFHFEKCLISFN